MKFLNKKQRNLTFHS